MLEISTNNSKKATIMVEFTDFFFIPRLFYRVIGCLPLIDGNRSNTEQSLLFITGLLSVAVALLQQLKFIASSSFAEATALAPCIGFGLLASFKIYIVWNKRHQLQYLQQGLEALFPNDKESQRNFKVEDFRKQNQKIVYFYLSFIVFGVISFAFFPICASTYEYFFKGRLYFIVIRYTICFLIFIILGFEFKYQFSFFMWYPFEIDNFVKYSLVQLQQMHISNVEGICFMATDTFLISLMMILIMLFTSVSKRLEDMIITGGEQDLIKLNELIVIHQEILNLADLNSGVFSVTVLFNFVSSTLLICLTFFQITLVELSFADLMRYIIFFIQQVNQVGTICYLGEMLIDSVSGAHIHISTKVIFTLYFLYCQSQGVTDAAYGQDWMSASMAYKKTLAIIITRSQKPSTLVAKTIGVVSMQILSKILSSSYRFFLFLKNVYKG